ncbi:hypothetical protein Pcinc_006579 [Petrolisthes cinctipes]|uniref:Uncharacterized protein n=1 Tax=Petrolisthes cinctipes TaxID=88211 RepID=A0AAE1GCN1_PETCI|nr:hypothetical protein Pcinc_006579 [Petrolisthes cinctipes]
MNHVSKRIGTRLRKLKKEMMTTITTKAGKEMRRSLLSGLSQLTENTINKMTSYFGKAVLGEKVSLLPNTMQSRQMTDPSITIALQASTPDVFSGGVKLTGPSHTGSIGQKMDTSPRSLPNIVEPS